MKKPKENIKEVEIKDVSEVDIEDVANDQKMVKVAV